MEHICKICQKPIENNQGTYYVKGTGGIFSRGIYPKTLFCVHWGECTNILDQDDEGKFLYWNHLPFCIQTEEQTDNSHRFIYVLKSGPYYKIGITKDVDKRMRELKTGDPVEHMFIHSAFIEDTPKFEKKVHEKFAEYRVREDSEWFELPPEKLEELLKILNNGDVESIPPLDNIVYYPVGTRVLWRKQPGVVHSLVIKTYKYEVGYNILLDTQDRKDQPEVTNSGYSELILESTGKPSLDGDKVEPISPDNSDIEIYTLAEALSLETYQ